MEDPKNQPQESQNPIIESNESEQSGLDKWNERLDENLETEDHNDELADENAKNFSEKFGSADQSAD
ncbi:hypothetical protein EZJ43_10990 [Pedobacter changchengzhani]|uniref:Uncharacterized protein n=1 Tax=Pedobacter changchengzhani TaxID=2529274 RepID=A0A4R5MJR7_9SPHI|nr:hypothetical protein [Pedobacter changchengzhani]TDG35874.1 hypothetical protein EZJ43_10990 [Pedobacter changchengzhani]